VPSDLLKKKAMIITSDYKKDFKREKKENGSYEWWYFDACDIPNDLQFVIIFYEGCPFSPDYIDKWENPATRAVAFAADHPAVSVSVYQHGKPVFYSLIEYNAADLIWDEEKTNLNIGQSGFRLNTAGDELVFHLIINEVLPGGDSILGDIKFKSGKTPTGLFGTPKQSGSMHEWNLSQPYANVTGTIRISGITAENLTYLVKAIGYHDHNYGREPMKLAFNSWYWGRIHMDSGTIIFYIMQKEVGFEHHAWMINSENTAIDIYFNEVELDDFRSGFFFLNPAHKIIMKSREAEITVQMSKKVDSGPFYCRFLCDAILRSDKENAIEVARGICEFIRPFRIHSKIFRPLVKMRYIFAGRKPHWVQKFPRLYRWTW
jgi:carotenoid 1,2-hydratase